MSELISRKQISRKRFLQLLLLFVIGFISSSWLFKMFSSKNNLSGYGNGGYGFSAY